MFCFRNPENFELHVSYIRISFWNQFPRNCITRTHLRFDSEKNVEKLLWKYHHWESHSYHVNECPVAMTLVWWAHTLKLQGALTGQTSDKLSTSADFWFPLIFADFPPLVLSSEELNKAVAGSEKQKQGCSRIRGQFIPRDWPWQESHKTVPENPKCIFQDRWRFLGQLVWKELVTITAFLIPGDKLENQRKSQERNLQMGVCALAFVPLIAFPKNPTILKIRLVVVNVLLVAKLPLHCD